MSKFKKNPDEPIASLKEDRFGREQFAISLAEALVKVPDTKSLTIGLYGTWGSGKTSIINLAAEYLTKKYTAKVVLITFNPWMFSTTESLHRAFFSTLAHKLNKKLDGRRQNIGAELQKYGDLTSPLSTAIGAAVPHAWPIFGALPRIMKGVGGGLKGSPVNIEAIRNRVDEILAESGKRVVVIIDDIDRLDSDEIHQIFKLVKNTAHFSNVSYLLAFDQVVVAEALAQRYPTNPTIGGSFIDKIVQLPLYVPAVDQTLLNKYLTEEIDKIIEQRRLDIPNDDMSRFQSTYFVQGADKLFTTPRKVVRYLNTIDFSLERLANEASFTDILLIDMLRNFFPEVYESIATNKQVILGRGEFRERDDSYKEATRKLLFGDNLSGMAVTITRELFPTVEWALGGHSYSDSFQAGWEEEKRICAEKYFNRYFAYDIPIGDIADAKIEAFLAELALPKTTMAKTEKLLDKLVKSGDPTLIIHKLRTQEDKLSGAISEKLATALISIGSGLPRTRGIGGDMFSPYAQAALLAVKLTRHVANTYPMLESFMKKVPVNYAAEIFRWVRFNTENDKNEEDFNPLISLEERDKLGELEAKRIKAYTKDHYIQEDFPDDTAYLMWIWNKWGNQADIRGYFEKSFKAEPKRAIEFLCTYPGYAQDLMTGKRSRAEFRREAYDQIAEAVDPEIFEKPLISLFGEDVNTGGFPDFRSGSDKPFDYQVAQQFLYIHRHVKDEKPKPDNELLEGEIITPAP
jgi:predicted KAP-like P-loop ATPase